MKLKSFFYGMLARGGRKLEQAEVRAILKYGMKPYQPPPFAWMGNYETHRNSEGTKLRWELMKPHLPAEPFTALDIGCHIGYFAFQLHRNGAGFVLGVDSHSGPLVVADKVKVLERLENIAFARFLLTPERSELLGSWDVVCFLSVFHHINLHYGFEAAKHTLSVLLKNTRKLMFFETGQSNEGCATAKAPVSMPSMEGLRADEYLAKLLRECGAKKVQYLGEVPMGRETTRSLLMVDQRGI